MERFISNTSGYNPDSIALTRLLTLLHQLKIYKPVGLISVTAARAGGHHVRLTVSDKPRRALVSRVFVV